MFSILLLDDDPKALSSLHRVLRHPFSDSATIHAFTDPYAALVHMDEHHVDLVMTDFRMPLMNGIQFLHFVRGLRPDTQRMIVSAPTDVNAIISAIDEVGEFRCVVKPWNDGVLVDDVRDALSEAAAQRERRRIEDFDGDAMPYEWALDEETTLPSILRRVH